jgi:hypothetical protein
VAGCGAQSTHGIATVDRSFAMHWVDHASSQPITYRTASVRLHDGRWSARISVHNGSGTRLYETRWAGSTNWSAWNGPALVYSGLDVLGDRKLIYLPADREVPAIPEPLEPGATWHGTIGGVIPQRPALPRGRPIWVRYPVFGLGRPWDYLTPSLAVQWISGKGVQL